MKDASDSYALGFILLSDGGLLSAGVLSRTLLQIATPIQLRFCPHLFVMKFVYSTGTGISSTSLA